MGYLAIMTVFKKIAAYMLPLAFCFGVALPSYATPAGSDCGTLIAAGHYFGHGFVKRDGQWHRLPHQVVFTIDRTIDQYGAPQMIGHLMTKDNKGATIRTSRLYLSHCETTQTDQPAKKSAKTITFNLISRDSAIHFPAHIARHKADHLKIAHTTPMPFYRMINGHVNIHFAVKLENGHEIYYQFRAH